MMKSDEIQLHWDKHVVMLGPNEYLLELRESHVRLIIKLEWWVQWIDDALAGLHQGILFDLESEERGVLQGPGESIKSHRRLIQQREWCLQTAGRTRQYLAEVDAEIRVKKLRKV